MYRVIVETRFSATHHIRLHDGTDEPKHGHDWNVRVTFARSALDDLGMVIDFAEAGKVLKQAIQKLHYADLNELPAFRGKNPTAEVVAQWILECIVELGAPSVVGVEVTEAPGCVAVFERN